MVQIHYFNAFKSNTLPIRSEVFNPLAASKETYIIVAVTQYALIDEKQENLTFVFIFHNFT